MSKRSKNDEKDSRPAKRVKHDQEHKPQPVEEIQFARQLQQLLAFRQDGLQQLRHGIASFKAFLESILYHKNEDDRSRELSILHEYLQSEKPSDATDPERSYLQQLWQAWSFANQNNNDRLVSSIAAIFALLLKTLSSLLEFREPGLLLCRTVLQHQNLRLIKWCLEAPKHKDFLISPCLRLLIEVTSFDGGVLAREVYKRREQTFDTAILRRNLGIVKLDLSEEELQRRPSIRIWTARYIITHLRYLHEGGLADIISNRTLCTALFQYLKNDSPDLIQELLSVLEQHVLKNSEIPRSAKASILVQQNIERVTEVASRSGEGHAAAESAFKWLKAVSSTASYGILRPSGWYPAGTINSDHSRSTDDTIDLGLDSVEFYDHGGRPDVRNPILLSYLQFLRPHNSLQERELALTCFTSAPELVSAYFSEKIIELEPKLTNTWIGHASFLFEVIRLPVPAHFGNEDDSAQLPPQTRIMIENILPQPLTQKVLTRCLNQSSELITYFAVQILVLAFDKLAKVQTMLSKAADASKQRPELWHEASSKLLTQFVERCPKMRDVINAFRKIPDDADHVLQREATTRLLEMYYETTPLQALEEQFDVSNVLATALLVDRTDNVSHEIREVKLLELQHLLRIARQSPGMRWFNKHGSLEYSPIVTLILIHLKDLPNRQIRELIYHVLLENYIFKDENDCDALLASLKDKSGALLHEIASCLEDWFLRATRQPVKYLDDLEDLASAKESLQDAEAPSRRLPSPFLAVLLEQVPYVSGKKDLVTWIVEYFQLLQRTDESSEAVETVYSSITKYAASKTVLTEEEISTLLHQVQLQEIDFEEPAPKYHDTDLIGGIAFSAPPTESTDHPELFTWAKKDVEMSLEEGDLQRLILCLCSQFPEIRSQAHAQLNKFLFELQKSDFLDKDLVRLLIGELIETYEQRALPRSEALPFLVGTFATNALPVQLNPTHDIYPKLNKYLIKGPDWRFRNLPIQWIKDVMHSVPYEDGSYWNEVQWVLDWLVDGLRTVADLEILRLGGVFEEVMCLYGSPGAESRKQVKDRVLELLWRATFIEGGSTTLITRTGILSWLDMVRQTTLEMRIIETCDKDRVQEWSGRSVEDL